MTIRRTTTSIERMNGTWIAEGTDPNGEDYWCFGESEEEAEERWYEHVRECEDDGKYGANTAEEVEAEERHESEKYE